jgi:hypothetical protein
MPRIRFGGQRFEVGIPLQTGCDIYDLVVRQIKVLPLYYKVPTVFQAFRNFYLSLQTPHKYYDVSIRAFQPKENCQRLPNRWLSTRFCL